MTIKEKVFDIFKNDIQTLKTLNSADNLSDNFAVAIGYKKRPISKKLNDLIKEHNLDIDELLKIYITTSKGRKKRFRKYIDFNFPTIEEEVYKISPLEYDPKKKYMVRKSPKIVQQSDFMLIRNQLVSSPLNELLKKQQLEMARYYKIPKIYEDIEFNTNLRNNAIGEYTVDRIDHMKSVFLNLLYNNDCYTVARYLGFYDSNLYKMFYGQWAYRSNVVTLEWKYMRLMHEKYKSITKCPRNPQTSDDKIWLKEIKPYVNNFFNKMSLNENDDIICKTEFGFNSIIGKQFI